MTQTIDINGVSFTNFGSNNYSHTASLICCPNTEDLVQRVLNGEFPNVYLNPSIPVTANDAEFFGIYSTEEASKIFQDSQKQCIIAKKVLAITGIHAELEYFMRVKDEITANYKHWWE